MNTRVTTTAQKAVKYRAWATYCARRSCPGFINPPTWALWQSGKSRPALTRVDEVAASWTAESKEVLRACGYPPAASAADLLRARAVCRRESRNARRKLRYSTDLEYRRKELERNKDRLKEKRPVNGPAPFYAHCLRLRAMGPEERKARDLELKRQRRKRRPKSGGWIRQQLSNMHCVMDRLERTFSKLEERERRPQRRGVVDRERQLLIWKAKTHRRDAKLHQLAGDWTHDEFYSLLGEFDYRCAYCGADRKSERRKGHDLEADHVVPITDPECVNAISNIVPACKRCNSSKGNRDLLEWSCETGRNIHPLALVKYNSFKGVLA